MPEKNQQLYKLLRALEIELKALALWQESRPSEEALRSTQPFCIDTLKFEQWLQFVFIEKLQTMLQLGHPLPTNISVCPIAEESFVELKEQAATIINIIADIDELLSGKRIQQKYNKGRKC